MAAQDSEQSGDRTATSAGEKEKPKEKPELSPSSKFNIKMMWRMNYLSIAIFVLALIYYIIKHI